MCQSRREGDEAKKRKSPAKSGRVGITGDVKSIIVRGIEHLLGESKGCPTMYTYMFHNYKLITNNVNIPFYT